MPDQTLRQKLEAILLGNPAWEFDNYGQWGTTEIQKIEAIVQEERKKAVEEFIERYTDKTYEFSFIDKDLTLEEMFPTPNP